jgi:choline dehydrogenase-like flavoprotein
VYLKTATSNLTIIPDSGVASILLEGANAVGVQILDGRKFYAKNEVIISAGALNTPQILMLSGIGPRDELEKHKITVLHELPQLGKSLQDHCFSPVGIVMKEDKRSSSAEAKQSPSPMAWIKLESVLASKEYDALPLGTKDFLLAPTVPSIEIATHIPSTLLSHEVAPGTTFLGAMCLIMNPQSHGVSSSPTS